jgi:polysaccharide deacetylase family protein (PEP-CTERM system associated)
VICLTFDVEERFHSHLAPAGTERVWRMEDRILAIIDELVARDRTATFFVVGELAEQFPDAVRRMSEAGFEVATHSHTHPRFDRHSHDSLREEITRSRKALEDITGERVLGFRAPSWSVHLEDEWLWDFLGEQGFRYDSSLFPFKTHMYGSWHNPPRPFRISAALLEIPASVHPVGPLRIPYGGGFYFRLYPWWVTRALMKRDLARAKTPVVYLHPWEFEPTPDASERGLNRFIANYNIAHTWSRMLDVLQRHETTTALALSESLAL